MTGLSFAASSTNMLLTRYTLALLHTDTCTCLYHAESMLAGRSSHILAETVLPVQNSLHGPNATSF